jgi:hypothetical protein
MFTTAGAVAPAASGMAARVVSMLCLGSGRAPGQSGRSQTTMKAAARPAIINLNMKRMEFLTVIVLADTGHHGHHILFSMSAQW